MDQTKELLEMPREFLKDGRQFLTRCSKRPSPPPPTSPEKAHADDDDPDDAQRTSASSSASAKPSAWAS
ncbi:protein translocase SEC6 [Teratosphaeria destructans]|uniref:Protein translocase SEC6 n=1 Tax=Teratosphaeria destructans TaxID=418781 RepID=A0A9W7SVE5_9PEZI|nr:protein translocase SEC6 [Teratosphaeria destructans]